MFSPAISCARCDRVARTGEIQVDRNLSGEHDREVRDYAAFARRQDDSDSLLGKILAEMPAQSRGRAEKFAATSERVVHSVDDRDAKRMLREPAQRRRAEVLPQAGRRL